MARRKTNEEFLDEVYEIVKNEYTFLEKYITYKTKMSVRHNKCSSEFKIRPAEFFKEWRCPICNKVSRKGFSKKTRTPEQFKKEYQTLVGDEYLFLEDYQGITNKISVIHNICGHEYKVSPDNF